MGKYYYLITGLADISFDDVKAPYTLDAFREQVWSYISKRDRRIMDLLLLETDCHNILSLLRDGELSSDARTGLYTLPKMEEMVAAVKADDCVETEHPFLPLFIKEYLSDEWQMQAGFAVDRILSMFYEYAMRSKNGFVSDWYRFNLDLNNIQSAFTARKYGLDIRSLIVGTGDVAEALRTSGARDWGLSQEVNFFDEMARIQEVEDLTQREHSIDMLKWNWLEEKTFFHYFTVEILFSYMVRLGIIERWALLDRDSGQRLFRRLIGGLKDQIEAPVEFRDVFDRPGR